MKSLALSLFEGFLKSGQSQMFKGSKADRARILFNCGCADESGHKSQDVRDHGDSAGRNGVIGDGDVDDSEGDGIEGE